MASDGRQRTTDQEEARRHEARLRALDAFFAEYEAREGAFTEEEMAAADRRPTRVINPPRS